MQGSFKLLLFLVLSGVGLSVHAQIGFPVNGTADEREGLIAFTNATIHTNYKTTLNKATLLVRKGKIEAAGTSVTIPPDAVVRNLDGMHIYPSFIEPFSGIGMPENKPDGGRREHGGNQIFESTKKGAYYQNQAIKPETDAAALFANNPAAMEELRKLGFGFALTHVPDGIARGTAAFVSLSEQRESKNLLTSEAASVFSFDKGSSPQDYPGSLMGAIALLRQAFADAEWYAKGGNEKQRDLSLEALNRQKKLPALFEVSNKYSALRAAKIGKEFGYTFIVKGAGDEYQRIQELKDAGLSFIIPLTFPAAYEVEDPLDAKHIPLEMLKHWEMAPANAALLANAGIPFSITAAGLKNKADFRKNLLKAVQYGLSKEQALQALTETPAKQLRVSSFSGALIPGAEANFFITDGDYFNEKTKLTESYIGSSRLSILPVSPTDIRGKYELSLGLDSRPLTLNISGKTDEPSYKLQRDTLKWDAKAVRSGDRITLSFSPTPKEKKSLIRLYGWQKGTDFAGSGELPDGTPVNWSAKYISGISDTVKKDSTQPKPQIGNIIYPFASFGRNELPKTADLVFRNATVWTNEQDGILENTDVWISGGKIKAVGKSLSAPGAAEIDAKGKHLSPGIIDEHSHIAISQGVNEGTQAVTSEVRIGDVLDCEDINIYRQLSGGVVASQLLHGSANPIGGQSALIKLRWGLAPEALKIEGADGFIKFALGENVKQSNWGDNRRTRFPQTRMGVEQVFTDAFTRAKAYKTELAGYTAGKGISPRRDLELEALCEILDRKRFITCHSYVQSEINMLMKTADSMGFKVNTFTHILEGYKVADKMKAHGAGGSTFSDWWAYKMEVQDAIPYNAAIMSKAGIVTAINSDDPEMGRRLNQEAGKINKYGNIPETEALKMITLNPAKLLHLDSRMGSIKPGKDADLVLWTDNPLSIYAKAEKTLVDGKIYFDRTEDLQLREALRKERARLINKMLTEKSKGAETVPFAAKPKKGHTCDDLEENYMEVR